MATRLHIAPCLRAIAHVALLLALVSAGDASSTTTLCHASSRTCIKGAHGVAGVYASSALTGGRPAPSQRRFVSPAVDNATAAIGSKMKDSDLGAVFMNALPNTLDTTIYSFQRDVQQPGNDDTFIITGDITAMWLRDSTNQVLPYLRYAKADPGLQALLRGTVNRQTKNILSDVYANAFNFDATTGTGDHSGDSTSRASYLGTRVNAMANKLVFERKYELDSLCAFLKLSFMYWNATGDLTPFGSDWLSAVTLVYDTMLLQQRDTAQEDDSGGPDYDFQRTTNEPSDSLLHGRGYPCNYTGMIKSNFRPSDDANIYCFSIPSNAMAVVALRNMAGLLYVLKQTDLSQKLGDLAQTVDGAIQTHGIISHAQHGFVYAYEVDGFGNHIFMDDANIPSLLSLPYLGYTTPSDPLYLRTRTAVLSRSNPWYFAGSATDGVGGPHNGVNYIWPMAIAVRAFTSTDDAEITKCLSDLKQSSAGSGFMHESFWKDDFGSYTRPWFAWANSLFGDLIVTLSETRPYLIF